MREKKVEVLGFNDSTHKTVDGDLQRVVSVQVQVLDDQLAGVEALALAAKAIQKMPTRQADAKEDESEF